MDRITGDGNSRGAAITGAKRGLERVGVVVLWNDIHSQSEHGGWSSNSVVTINCMIKHIVS